MSILSCEGHLPYRYCHLPYRYCHLKVIFRIDTVNLSSCGQDDQIISFHPVMRLFNDGEGLRTVSAKFQEIAGMSDTLAGLRATRQRV